MDQQSDAEEEDLYGDLEAEDAPPERKRIRKDGGKRTMAEQKDQSLLQNPSNVGSGTTSAVNAATTHAASLPSFHHAEDGRPMSILEENQVLRTKLQEALQENETLKRNMGTLYRTAVAEIQRKDAALRRYEDEHAT